LNKSQKKSKLTDPQQQQTPSGYTKRNRKQIHVHTISPSDGETPPQRKTNPKKGKIVPESSDISDNSDDNDDSIITRFINCKSSSSSKKPIIFKSKQPTPKKDATKEAVNSYLGDLCDETAQTEQKPGKKPPVVPKKSQLPPKPPAKSTATNSKPPEKPVKVNEKADTPTTTKKKLDKSTLKTSKSASFILDTTPVCDLNKENANSSLALSQSISITHGTPLSSHDNSSELRESSRRCRSIIKSYKEPSVNCKMRCTKDNEVYIKQSPSASLRVSVNTNRSSMSGPDETIKQLLK
jgi:hypothetical protein